MVKFTLIPQPLREIYDQWSGVAKAFHKKASKYEDIFLGDVDDSDTPFDKDQLKRIHATTGVDASINRIYSTTSQAIAYLSRKHLSHRMVATSEKFKNHAITIDKLKEGIMVDSVSVVSEEESIKDMLISGMGCKIIKRPDNPYTTIFPATIEHIHNSEVILDVNCTDRTLKKMQGFWIDKEIPLEEAKQYYSKTLELINQVFSHQEGWQNVDWTTFTNTTGNYHINTNRRAPESLQYSNTVWTRQYYDKVFSTCYLIEDRKYGLKKVFKENLFPSQYSLLNNAVTKEEGLYIRKSTLLGNHIVDVEMIPVHEWPLIVKFFEWGGKPYKSKGFVHYGLPLQQAYDSTMQLLLLHGYVTTNAGYKAPRDAIKVSEKSNWEKDLLNPLKLKLYDPVVINDQVFVPERDQPGQISNFYPDLLRLLQEGFNEITGFDPILLGNTQTGKVETFSTFTKYETAAMQRIMKQFDHISIAQQQEGVVLIDYITSEMKPEEVYIFLDSKGTVNEIKYAYESIKEAKLAKYKVYSVPHESSPTQRISVSQQLFNIAQTSTDPSEKQLFINYALKLQDIREVDNLLEDLDQIKSLKQALNQYEEGMKREQELFKQMENRALRAEYREKLMARLIKAIEKIAKEEQNELLGSKIRQLEDELKEANAKNKSGDKS